MFGLHSIVHLERSVNKQDKRSCVLQLHHHHHLLDIVYHRGLVLRIILTLNTIAFMVTTLVVTTLIMVLAMVLIMVIHMDIHHITTFCGITHSTGCIVTKDTAIKNAVTLGIVWVY